MMIRRGGIFAALLLAGCLGTIGIIFGLMPIATMLRSASVSSAPKAVTQTLIFRADNSPVLLPVPAQEERASEQVPRPATEVAAVSPEHTYRKPLALNDEDDDTSAAEDELPAAPDPRLYEELAAVQPSLQSGATGSPDDKRQPSLAAKKSSKTASFSILQIGDSHTSADFFSGQVRRRLQAIFGNGGPGYVTAGRPHIGVLSASTTIISSKGWSYKAVQRSDDVGSFWLSGFNAVATAANETMTFVTEQSVRYDMIEFEVLRRPGGGTIEIRLDGVLEGTYDLSGDRIEPIVIRLVPKNPPTERVRRIAITTKNDGAVYLASVGTYNTRSGIIYNSVGYPGATVDIINKLDRTLFANDLKRLNPQIVVLSFGTNEASKVKLDPQIYAKTYRRAINKITSVLPSAQIVLIGPPDGAELSPHCKSNEREHATCRGSGHSAAAEACVWSRLPRLDMVREAQRDIAQRDKLEYWNWASMMPAECGTHLWATMSPPLMGKDHVHFSKIGYRKSAAEFTKVLTPIIERLKARSTALSNN